MGGEVDTSGGRVLRSSTQACLRLAFRRAAKRNESRLESRTPIRRSALIGTAGSVRGG